MNEFSEMHNSGLLYPCFRTEPWASAEWLIGRNFQSMFPSELSNFRVNDESLTRSHQPFDAMCCLAVAQRIAVG